MTDRTKELGKLIRLLKTDLNFLYGKVRDNDSRFLIESRLRLIDKTFKKLKDKEK